MKRNVLLTSLLFSALLFLVFDVNAAKKKKDKKDNRPLIEVVQKDGKKAKRRCFVDKDKNGFCDNGSDQKQKRKCKNNCHLAAIDEKLKKLNAAPDKELKNPAGNKTAVQLHSPCSACPLAGNCAGECLALLKK